MALMGESSLFPLEFFVAATPRSLGASARSKGRWRDVLRSSARNRISETVEFWLFHERPLALTIFYFAAARAEGDVDNIVKPIQDALIGVAYLDDRVIERVVVQWFEPETDWAFAQPTAALVSALETEVPVVYVRIDVDLSWRQN